LLNIPLAFLSFLRFFNLFKMIGLLVSFLAAASVINAAVVVGPALNPVNVNMPQWNFANESTPDAKADGSVGVIIVGIYSLPISSLT
jgi:hypothetical protein